MNSQDGLSAAEVAQENRNNIHNLLVEIAIAIKTRYVGFQTIHIQDSVSRLKKEYNPEAMGLFAHYETIVGGVKKAGHHALVYITWTGNGDLFIAYVEINGMPQQQYFFLIHDTVAIIDHVFGYLDQTAVKRSDMKIESGRKYNVWHKETIAVRLSPGDLMVTAAKDSGPYFNRIQAIELVTKADIENGLMAIETDRGGSYIMDKLDKVRIATFVASVA